MSIRPVEDIIAILLSFVIAITVHEFMHAWTAHKLGDNTARNQGRITLNPMSHFEPFGFIGMVLISIGFFFIGWGKPVPVQPGNFKGTWARRRKQGMLLVTAAGPLSNVALALIVAVPWQLAVRNGVDLGQLGFLMQWFISINALLAAFNMIPVPPLDGYKILTGILPDFWRPVLQPLEQYGFVVLLLLLFVGGRISTGGQTIVGGMIEPVQRLILDIVTFGLA